MRYVHLILSVLVIALSSVGQAETLTLPRDSRLADATLGQQLLQRAAIALGRFAAVEVADADEQRVELVVEGNILLQLALKSVFDFVVFRVIADPPVPCQDPMGVGIDNEGR